VGKLIYAANVSLDGFTEDAGGGFTWGVPDDDLFAFITDVMRSAGAYLYGRRMYETLAVWETDPALAALSPLAAGDGGADDGRRSRQDGDPRQFQRRRVLHSRVRSLSVPFAVRR
jgi:dihydrofolate reductase